ncbi:hypothetical protein BGZ93_009236 [Podila epicladia]|nr:hypothetical protein BGZ92_001701 [Podila epicladia]KAG0090587.1 hypothetical protein BGZ93_009236 [Podila epicladia]
MRPAHAAIALALCLSIVHAQDQQATFDTPSQQQQEAQQPEQEKWQTTPDDYPFKPTAPSPPTADQLAQAKSGLQQLMAELNVKHVEPLFNTMDGYCFAFKGLCTAACAERIKLSKTQDRRDGEIAMEDASDYAGGQEVKGCIDPQAQTVAAAGALCQCAGYDMTDRINFAVVGGIVTSEPPTPTSSSGFGAMGILDSLTNLPSVPTFLSIIHVMQNVCFYVGFLDILATNPHPATCPANPLAAITAAIPGLGPVLGGLIPGLGGVLGGVGGGEAKKDGGIGDLLGGILGGGQSNGGKDGGGGSGGGGGGVGLGSIGDIIGKIIGGIKPPAPAPLPITEPTPEPVLPPPAPPATPSHGGRSPTPSPKPRVKLFGLFSENDTHYSQEDRGVDKHEVEESHGTDRLVSHDGRVAKIVRMKKRGQAMREVKNERRDFL